MRSITGLVIILVLLFVAVAGEAYEVREGTKRDSSDKVLDGSEIADSISVDYRSPLKAGILSAIIPGGGQVYNQSYIKAALAIGLEGLFLGYALKYDKKADKYYDDWKESDSSLDYQYYERYYERRANYYWWFGITIFVSTMDAVTDAYLHDFEYEKNRVRLKFNDQALMIEYDF